MLLDLLVTKFCVSARSFIFIARRLFRLWQWSIKSQNAIVHWYTRFIYFSSFQFQKPWAPNTIYELWLSSRLAHHTQPWILDRLGALPMVTQLISLCAVFVSVPVPVLQYSSSTSSRRAHHRSPPEMVKYWFMQGQPIETTTTSEWIFSIITTHKSQPANGRTRTRVFVYAPRGNHRRRE